jgi:2-polyprenyl-6-methoxyphenol hydroxylase-like FAD-dependent oxidoreductase
MTQEADVIVIGGGGAGLTAAAEAARLGRRVVLLEKNPTLGGTTALAVGSIMAACSAIQRAAGVEDSPRRHALELAALAKRLGIVDDPDLVELFTEHAGATVDFLEAIGVDFLGPLEQPPFQTRRFHVALPGGRAYVRRLAAYCARHGVSMRLGARVTRLLKSGDRVDGLEMQTAEGRAQLLRARAGIVLASGDFSANREMRGALLSADTAALQEINSTATGDGQKMALEVGARLHLRPDLGLAHLAHARFIPPSRPGLVAKLPAYRLLTRAMKLTMRAFPASWLRPWVMKAAMTALSPERPFFERGAILVNHNGERFADELAAPGGEIARQPGGEAFVLLDGRLAREFSAWPNYVSTAPGVAYAYVNDYRRARSDIFYEAGTVAGLAARLGMPAGPLEQTLRERNLAEPPFVAIGPMRAWLLLTPVGTAVNRRLQVLDNSGQPIQGLFAAGGAGQGGFTTLAHGHGLGWAFTSGRLAGRYAAFNL